MTEENSKITFTRRRALKISGALLGLSTVPGHAASSLTRSKLVTWHGIALGAAAEMQIAHVDTNEGRHILELAVAELGRLEKIFSLYDETSDLSRLNRQGFLVSPPSELIEVLSTSLSIARLSGGAFDPSVQVLWNQNAQGGIPQSIPDHVGYRNITISAREIRLEHDTMALTLNGIAQGYITDCITALLRDAGLNDVLVDCGEVYGAGSHPSGRLWQVALADNPAGPLPCQNQAIATSASTTVMPGHPDLKPHLFDPLSGVSVERYRTLSVMAPSAILADGLSTALSILVEEEWNDVLKTLAGQDIRVYGVRKDGTLVQTATA